MLWGKTKPYLNQVYHGRCNVVLQLEKKKHDEWRMNQTKTTWTNSDKMVRFRTFASYGSVKHTSDCLICASDKHQSDIIKQAAEKCEITNTSDKTMYFCSLFLSVITCFWHAGTALSMYIPVFFSQQFLYLINKRCDLSMLSTYVLNTVISNLALFYSICTTILL